MVYDDADIINNNTNIKNLVSATSIFENEGDDSFKNEKEIDINNIKSIKELNNYNQGFILNKIDDINDNEIEVKKDLIEHISEINSDLIIDNKKYNKNEIDLIDNYVYRSIVQNLYFD